MSGARPGQRAGQCVQRGRQPEGEELERHGRVEPVDRLVGRHDDDEPVGRRCHDPLTGVGAPTPLDQPTHGVDLVCAVDGQVEPLDVGEGPDIQPLGDGQLLGRRRRRRARDVQVPQAEHGDELGDRRAGPQPDPHATLDEGRRRLRGGALLRPDVGSRHGLLALSCAARPSTAVPCRCGRRPEARAPAHRGCCA